MELRTEIVGSWERGWQCEIGLKERGARLIVEVIGWAIYEVTDE